VPNCRNTLTSGANPKALGMADFEVHIDLDNNTRPIGVARCNRVRGTEVILFEYDHAWLNDPDHFALEPALTLTRGTFAPPAGLATFGSIGDSAPDAGAVATVTATWRDTAKAAGARSAQINRMASTFEHDDLKRALAL
jgi:hypothetical protein